MIPDKRRRRRRGLAAGLILLAAAIVFLREPITRFKNATYINNYLCQFHLFSDGRARDPENDALGDPEFQQTPGSLFGRREILAGRVPLWNPSNACGAPHLAAPTMYPAFPVFVLLSLLPLKIGLLLGPLLRLLLLGIGMITFLRLAGASWPAATAGALTFSYGAFHLVWLAAPQPNASAVLPLALVFIEVGLRREIREPGGGVSQRGPLAGLAITVALAGGSGHPEVALVALTVAAAYAALRLPSCPPKSRRRLFTGWMVAAGAGVLLAAPQLLPFLEYVAHSDVVRIRGTSLPSGFHAGLWTTTLFPNVLGAPQLSFDAFADLPDAKYAEEIGSHVGVFPLLLALTALVLRPSDRRVWLFASIGGAWWVVCHRITAISLLPVSRTTDVWLFSIAVLATLSVDAATSPVCSRGRSWTALAFGVSVFLIAAFSASRLAARNGLPSGLPTGFAGSAAAIVGGVAGIAALRRKRPLVRGFGLLLLASAVYGSAAEPLRRYNPTVPDAEVFPAPKAVERLASAAGGNRIVTLGLDSFPADANLPYGLSILASYDALWVRHLDELYIDMTGRNNVGRMAGRVDAHAARVFGAPFVLAAPGSAPLDEENFERVEFPPPLTLYRVRGGAPRVHVVTRLIEASTPEEERRLVESPLFDPDTEAVLPLGLLPRAVVPRSERAGVATISGEDPQRVTIRVSARRPSILVLSDTDYPGWLARSNGKPVPVLRANAAFRAVAVPAGDSTVEFRYRPRSFLAGLGIAATTALLGVVSLLRGRPTARV